MDMNHFQPETHVAQQSRRHKLRIQQSSTQPNCLEDCSSNLEQVPLHPGLDPDLSHVRNDKSAHFLYNPSSVSSEMLDCSNSNGLHAPKPNVSHPSSYNLSDFSRSGGNMENPGVWRSVGSHQNSDRMINFSSGSTGCRSSHSPMFMDMPAHALLAKIMHGHHDVQSPVTNPSSEISSQDGQHQYQEMNSNSSQLNYPNVLREVVTSVAIERQTSNNVRENDHSSNWVHQGGNELVLRSSYGEDSNVLNQNNASSWVNRVVEGGNQWSGELGFLPNRTDGGLRTIGNDPSTQGLFLTLSSNPSSGLHGSQFGERNIPEALSSRSAEITNVSQDLKVLKPSKPTSRGLGGSLQDIVGTSNSCNRQMGPLGPFTGYATILKSSKFLRPAQQILDEFCSMLGSKIVKASESWEKIPGEVCALTDAICFAESEVQTKGGASGGPLSTFHSSDDQLGRQVVAESSSCDSHRPEYQQKKAKLLYMQEEVPRRYKQYHQQMQMVVSSFESVAGLSAAAPYVSLALKTVSRHFRYLKNGISEQLRNIRTNLGEDLSSQTAGTSNSKSNIMASRLKMVDHNFPNQKFGGANMGFLAPQQHIWRPQRGLPERAVAVLRAWLFEHFLHPYPTDTDKHMLATQTGLTRNQVSNWFINARVRLWKPMVEEIHMLETKGVAERDANLVKDGENHTIECTSKPNSDHSSNELGVGDMTMKQLESSRIGSSSDIEHWNQEKRSRVEGPITLGMDGTMMSFMPYYKSGFEMGGLGSVSLTLGLRQSADHRHVVEGARYQHEQFQQEDHVRRHFGGHTIHEFVG